MIKDVPGIFFPKLGSKGAPFLTKGQKKALHKRTNRHFKPKFSSLGPLVWILQDFKWRHTRFLTGHFWPIIKIGGSSHQTFRKKVLTTSSIIKRILSGSFYAQIQLSTTISVDFTRVQMAAYQLIMCHFRPVIKKGVRQTLFWQNIFWKHLRPSRGLSRDHFKPKLSSLRPFMSILQDFEWRHSGF